MAKQFTYSKEAKIKSKKELDNLFINGKSFLVFPLKVMYSFSDVEEEINVKFGVGVSKKKFPHATDRNRVKRLLRETYRLNKHKIIDKITTKQLNIFVLFIDNKLPEKRMSLDSKIEKVFEKLINIYTNELDIKNP